MYGYCRKRESNKRKKHCHWTQSGLLQNRPILTFVFGLGHLYENTATKEQNICLATKQTHKNNKEILGITTEFNSSCFILYWHVSDMSWGWARCYISVTICESRKSLCLSLLGFWQKHPSTAAFLSPFLQVNQETDQILQETLFGFQQLSAWTVLINC